MPPPKPEREQRSHGEDYPGSNEAERPEEQYDAPPSGPGEPQPPHPGSKPKPADR
jgi:hypothetical protein